MAITRPKPKAVENAAKAEAFISGAPDAARVPKPTMLGNKRQISLTINPALLEKVDEMATEMGQSRAAIINMAIYRMVEHGVTIDGLRKE
ncbi:ribbon-helix-helix protein, CopG family [Yersinia enterocolitica]|nr:ribbon-helix-helix protein, CopG family [Yersinia enterocolitica]